MAAAPNQTKSHCPHRRVGGLGEQTVFLLMASLPLEQKHHRSKELIFSLRCSFILDLIMVLGKYF